MRREHLGRVLVLASLIASGCAGLLPATSEEPPTIAHGDAPSIAWSLSGCGVDDELAREVSDRMVLAAVDDWRACVGRGASDCYHGEVDRARARACLTTSVVACDASYREARRTLPERVLAATCPPPAPTQPRAIARASRSVALAASPRQD